MSFNKHELMDFEKFATTIKKLIYNDEEIYLEGVFREGNEIIKGDNFLAKKVNESGKKLDIELIYRTYLEWFNYTRNDNEKERFFVSVKELKLKIKLKSKEQIAYENGDADDYR